MVGDLAPVRAIPGRYMDGIQCRRCSTAENVVVEIFPHVLGQCPFGAVIRNHRHGRIRALIVNAYRKKYLELNEKVTALTNKVSIKRSSIIVWNTKRNSSLILDPTIELDKSKI